jgi:hypothetical protein
METWLPMAHPVHHLGITAHRQNSRLSGRDVELVTAIRLGVCLGKLFSRLPMYLYGTAQDVT